MADSKSTKLSKQSKYWIPSEKSWNYDSLVPGVNDVGNQRPKPKVKGGKTREVRAVVPVKQPVLVETTDNNGKTTCNDALSTDISTLGTDISTLHATGVTLKDLCSEDKKRIANLIKELARVGEEKENAEHNLSEERQHYQNQIMTLVHQQESILQEREEVQSRLLQYQNYIIKLQQQQQFLKQQQHHFDHVNHKHQLRSRRSNSKLKGDQNGLNLQDREGEAQKRKEKSLTKHSNNIENPPTHSDGLQQGSDTEKDEEPAIDEPSTHLYINESVDQSQMLGGLSTNVIPPQSPPQYTRPLPHRPFTELIDRQLSKEREKLESFEIADEEKSDYEMKHGKPVSPEKVEIFSRFMGSHQSNGGVNKEKQDRVELQEKHVKKYQDDKKEKGLERKGGKPMDQKHKKNSKPVASYPGFYPPIMSSTQKSSEIGDCVAMMDSMSTTSQMVEKKKSRRRNKVGDKDYVIEYELVKREKKDVDVSNNEMNDKIGKLRSGFGNNNYDQANSEIDGRVSKEEVLKSRVDFKVVAEGDVDNNDMQSLDSAVDQDYLLYYKKLSASDRKKELLNQRAALMEEQNKLKQLLMKHDHKSTKIQQLTEKQDLHQLQLEIKGQNQHQTVEETEVILDNDEIIISGHGVKKASLHKVKHKDHATELLKDDDDGSLKGQILRGTDGDECVTYDGSDDAMQRETGTDPVVKKLNYSLLSEENTDSPSELDKKFVASPPEDQNLNTKMSSSPNALSKMAASLHPVMIDAETSTTSINSKCVSNGAKKDMIMQGKEDNFDRVSTPSHNLKATLKHGERKWFSESPGDKTLAVLEIINSLPDNENEPSLAYRENKSYGSRSKYHSADISKNRNDNNQTSKSSKTKRSLFQQNIPRQATNINFGTDGFQSRNANQMRVNNMRVFADSRGVLEKRNFGSGRRMIDEELDVFECVGWKEDRLNGLRKIVSAESEEEDDETGFEYDDNDNSNLDDIMDNLLVCSNTDQENEHNLISDEEFNSSVILSLNKFGKNNLSSACPRQLSEGYSEESDILDDIFFVN